MSFQGSVVTGIIVTWLYLRRTRCESSEHSTCQHILNDAMQLVGPPPNEWIRQCNIVRRDGIIFFDFLVLLVFELGQNELAFGSYPH
jgi:prolipoprotein diacylglyceryltransferase